MADKPNEDQKVFALKILRKCDSKGSCRPSCFKAQSLTSFVVIRLKQVEHIKNERNTLAAVAGHPFITTMITSFADRDCLYMLVRIAANEGFQAC